MENKWCCYCRAWTDHRGDDCKKNPRVSCKSELAGSVAPLSESQIVDLLRKHGISVMIGERHSVRCQFGQIVNVVRELEKQPNDLNQRCERAKEK